MTTLRSLLFVAWLYLSMAVFAVGLFDPPPPSNLRAQESVFKSDLATAMVFLVFLYWLAAMFLFGGEVNGTVIAARRARLQARMKARQAGVRDPGPGPVSAG